MTDNADKAESKWRHRCQTSGDVEPPERLALIRSRIEEASRMLLALENRYHCGA